MALRGISVDLKHWENWSAIILISEVMMNELTQYTLRPTKWVTLECTKNNSTGPHKPIRISLLAKITWGISSGFGHMVAIITRINTQTHVFANYSLGKSIAHSIFKVYFSTV